MSRQPAIPRGRLPTLAEVLRRSTRPPVDLYCFYLYLQREGSEDALDFWLDVQQHENLCRAYFKDVIQSGKTVQEDWPQYYDYARIHGSLYGATTGIKRGDEPLGHFPSHGYTDNPSTSRGYENRLNTPDVDQKRLSAEQARNLRTPSPTASDLSRHYPLSPTLRALYPHDATRQGTKNQPMAQPFIPRDQPISRTDLIGSAERIFTRYLAEGGEKEIYLPQALRIDEFPLSSSVLPTVTHPDYDKEVQTLARIPDMFHSQKEYVYRSMEMDTFPRFLRTQAFGNLTPVGALVRLGFGLLCLWIGLALAFSFIFLDTKPKVTRLWIILPFTLAVFNIVARGYDVDPLLVFMGLSETTPFHTIGIREPYVRKLLFGRAIWVTFLSTILIAILTVVFWAVPGYRL